LAAVWQSCAWWRRCRFYTLIPHDFGLKKPPLLDSEEIIKTKTQMVDNLLEIEVAYSLLQDEQTGDPIDTNYHKLKTDLQVALYCTWQMGCV
jgi:poly [ADP-ribose] polymerase